MDNYLSIIVMLVICTILVAGFLFGSDGNPGAIETTQNTTNNMVNVIDSINSTIPVD